MGSTATLANISTAMQVVGTVTSASAAYTKSKQERAAYDYQAQVAENNSVLAEWQARDAIRRGQEAEGAHRIKVAQLKGSQRASLAGRGIDLTEGSALDILSDTDFMGERDALTIRNNASREAFGHRVESGNYRSNADVLRSRAAMEKPGMAAGTSLLTGAGQVANTWYTYKSKGVKGY